MIETHPHQRQARFMPTAYLTGNHDPCDACALRREAQNTARLTRPDVPCNVCGGVGYLPLSTAEIVRRTCDEARRLYWPAFDARIQKRKGNDT